MKISLILILAAALGLVLPAMAMEAKAVGSANDGDDATVGMGDFMGGDAMVDQPCDGADGVKMNKVFDSIVANLGDDMGQLEEALAFLTACGSDYCSLDDLYTCVEAKQEQRLDQRRQASKDFPIKYAARVEVFKEEMEAFLPQLLESSKLLDAQETFEISLALILDKKYKNPEQRLTVTTQLVNLVKATKHELQEDLFKAANKVLSQKRDEIWERAKDAIEELHGMNYYDSPLMDTQLHCFQQLNELRDQAVARVEELYQAAWKQIRGDVQEGGIGNSGVEDEPMPAGGSSDSDEGDTVAANDPTEVNIDDMVQDVADPAVTIADDAIVRQAVHPFVAEFLSESKLLVEKAWNSKAEEEALNRLHDDLRGVLHFSELCSTKHSSLADVSACIQAKVEARRHQGQQEMKLLDQPLAELKSALAAFPPQLESKIRKTLEKFETVLVNILDAYEKAQLQTGVAASRIMDFRKATKNEIQELHIETDMNAWVVTEEAVQRAEDAKLHDMDSATKSPFWKLFTDFSGQLDNQHDEAMAHVAEKCKAAWVQINGDFEGGGVPYEMESTEPSEL
ncbi:expressed unknown protein [Seminavis robusta]|uniref:Uncharacterized protein n=1 Tax=Seminavis robusta TaxID=568900 RepID=A0A9N8EMC4_9STRA|nr:expressed unknown protein [Seminavis robusta]|eukprot:Sro1205_g252310.1 n/a (568) ;mRNA; r:27976-29896